MSRTRIFIPAFSSQDLVVLDIRELIHKLRNVLRVKTGEDVFVFDGEGLEYQYKVVEMSAKKVSLKKIGRTRQLSKPHASITLAFPLTREDKIDLILQKATELGADEFIPFTCERCLVREIKEEKIERWQKIVIEACRQSERLFVPKVNKVVSLEHLDDIKYSQKFVASIDASWLPDVVTKKEGDFLIVVGPEGDFSQNEFAILSAQGFQGVKLSLNLLRVETAAIAFAAILRSLIK